MAKRATYYSDIIESIINPDPHGVESFSGRVGFLIAAADACAKEATPALPIGEWMAIADANNGVAMTYEAGPEFAVSGMILNVQDSPHLDAQFGIDRRALVQKLVDLPFAGRLAVFEVNRRFWLTAPAEGATYPEIFAACGAKIAAVE